MSNPANRHDELRALLERLNLGGMAAAFADLALKAAKENISHEAYFWSWASTRRSCAPNGAPHDCCVLQPFLADKTFRTLNLESSRACAPASD